MTPTALDGIHDEDNMPLWRERLGRATPEQAALLDEYATILIGQLSAA